MVWLWVDGCDMRLVRETKRLTGKYPQVRRTFSVAEEITFSIRSYYQHLPWHRGRLLLVTAMGQVPKSIKNYVRWKDLCALPSENARRSVYSPDAVTKRYHKFLIVDHTDFMKATQFNSTNIEASIHNIPQLSRVFVEWNDDFFALKHIPPSFFICPKTNKLINYHNNKKWNFKRDITDTTNNMDNSNCTCDEKDCRNIG